jgi:hypothetical protein
VACGVASLFSLDCGYFCAISKAASKKKNNTISTRSPKYCPGTRVLHSAAFLVVRFGLSIGKQLLGKSIFIKNYQYDISLRPVRLRSVVNAG